METRLAQVVLLVWIASLQQEVIQEVELATLGAVVHDTVAAVAWKSMMAV